jgi:hypothetical protein
MLFFNQARKYFAEAEGDGTAGGGTSEPEKVFTASEVEELTKGLKSKLDELLTEKKSASKKAQEAEQARLAMEQESARKSGELDRFEASLRGEFSKRETALSAELEAWKNTSLSEAKAAIISSMAGSFIDDTVPRSAKMFLNLEVGEGGKFTTKFTDPDTGEVLTTDIKEFLKLAAKDPELSRLMKSTTATGGGAAGSKGAGGAKPFDQMNETDRSKLANTDPARFAQLLSQQK